MQNPRPSTIHDKRYKSAIQVLIHARKVAGLSQSDLAEKVGFTQPDISKIECLERRLDIIEFFDILDAISAGDRSIIDGIWNKINESHRRCSAS